MIKKLIKKLFYYLVYKEYIKEKSIYLCYSSKLFIYFWFTNRNFIIEDAELFLRSNPALNEQMTVRKNLPFLFFPKEKSSLEININEEKYIRAQFLYWMIYGKLKNINGN